MNSNQIIYKNLALVALFLIVGCFFAGYFVGINSNIVQANTRALITENY